MKKRKETFICTLCGKPTTVDRPVTKMFKLPKITTCSSCMEASIQHDKAADKKRHQTARDAEWRDLCPNIYRDTVPSRLAACLLEAVQTWDVAAGKGLLFRGPSGTGKTRTAWLAMKRAFDAGKTCAATNGGEFSRTVAMFYSESPAKAGRWIESLIRVDVLLLDDLGKGRLTDRVATELFDIVEERMSHYRPVIYTLNMTAQELNNALPSDVGDSLLRRLRESSHVINITAT